MLLSPDPPTVSDGGKIDWGRRSGDWGRGAEEGSGGECYKGDEKTQNRMEETLVGGYRLEDSVFTGSCRGRWLAAGC